MLMPSIFGESFLNDFIEPFETSNNSSTFMNTDVEENEKGYMITIDIPGVHKEDVHAELKDGYLTVEATSHSNNDEKDERGNYIRRERYYGTANRSFYVGNDITQEDIKAKFENGTLKMFVPKIEPKPQVEDKKYIPIEG